MGRWVRGRGERGAGSLEYVAAAAIAGVLVLGVATAARGSQLVVPVRHAICSLVELDGCGPGTAGGSGEGADQEGVDQDFGENGDRRDQQRGARDDRRGRGTDGHPGTGLPGSTTPQSPLGPPVPGSSAAEPDPPEWHPVDAGAGEHGSENPSLADRGTDFAAEAAANALAGKWPAASRNLLHFLGNSGEPLEQDVNGMLDEIPEFASQVEADRTALGLLAVRQAREQGVTGPVTFPLNTGWQGYGYNPPYQNRNWFYALGGWQYNLTGQVTVYPPTTPGGKWTYRVSSRVNIRDQYNWDGGKSTQIGPFTVTDEQLARLHRVGLAQEFTAYGRSDMTTVEGSAP